MLTIVLDKPGVFSAHDGPTPTPKGDEVLVRVHRIGVCGTDLHAFAGRQPFFSYPRILGHELGVEVIDPGSDLQIGERCSVEPYLNCGHCIACRRGKPNCCSALQVMGVHIDGGMRPIIAVPRRKLHRSSKLDFEQLALIETLAIGAHAVERATIVPEDFVLVIGAGPIGLSVIQFVQVTGARLAVLDVNDARLAFCRTQLKVEHTIKVDDPIEQLKTIGGGDLPTVVIDATGNPHSMAATFNYPAHGGRIVFVGLFQGDVTFNDPNFHRRELTLLASRNALPNTFESVIRLVEEGRIDTRPWITHRFPLAETPQVFPSQIAGNPAVIKAMISVP